MIQRASTAFASAMERITRPSPLLTASDERNQAKLLAATMLVFLPLMLLATFVTLPIALSEHTNAESPAGILFLLGLGSVAWTVVAYGLSRTRYYQIGALVFTFLTAAAIYLGAILSQIDLLGRSLIILWLPLIVLVGSLFLTARATAILSALSITAVGLLPILNAGFSPSNVAGPLMYTLAFCLFIYSSKRYRSRLEAEHKLSEATLTKSEQDYRALYETAERQAQELKLLDQVRTALAQSVDLPDLFHVITQSITQAFGYTQVSVYLIKGNELVLQDQTGYEQTIEKIEITQGIAGQVARTGKPVLIENVQSNPDFLAAIPGIVSEICVPLMQGDQVVGIFNIESTQGVKLTEADLQLMVALGKTIEVALGRAQLVDDLTQQLTERQQAEEALQEATGFLRQVVDTSPSMIFVVDSVGRAVFANQYTAQYYGTTVEELIAKSTESVHRAESEAKEFVSDDQRVIRTRTKIVREELNTAPNGEQHWFQTVKVPLVRPDGTVDVLGIATDITERKRAEDMLRESEEKFRALVENSHGGVFLIDDSFHLAYANQKLAELSGYSQEELIGMDFRQLVDEVNHEFVTDRYVRRHQGEDVPNNYEFEILRKDGTKRQIEISVALIRFQDGSKRTIGQVLDITERHKAEEARKQYAERLEVLHEIDRAILIEQTPEAIAEAALKQLHDLIPLRGASVMLFNLEKDIAEVLAVQALTNRNLRVGSQVPLRVYNLPVLRRGDVYVVNDVEAEVPNHPYYKEMLAEGIHSFVNVPLAIQDRLLGSLNISAAKPGAFSDAQIEIACEVADQLAIAILHADLHMQVQRHADELEQRVIERTAQVQQTSDRIAAILESVGEAIMVVNPDGRIMQVNRAFEEQTGYAASEIELHHHREFLLDGAMPADIFDASTEAMRAGNRWRGEVPARRKDGSTYDTAVTITPMHDQKGDTVAFVGIIRDISTLKEVERMKDTFVSNVSHELRTPITNIGIYLNLLDRKPENLPAYVATLRRENTRLENLIEGLLMLSRLDQNRTEVNLAPLELNGMVEEYVADRFLLARQKELELTFEPAAKLPTCQADRQLLGQVLSIFLTNSLNYTPAGGIIRVTTQARQLKKRKWVGFSVADSGPGLAPGEIDKLFTRFFRGKAGLKSGVAGTGLGLAIAKEIVGRHLGEIEVQNEGLLDRGATFSVWLPANIRA